MQANAAHANYQNQQASKPLPGRYVDPPPLDDDFLEELHNDPVIDYFLALDEPLGPPQPHLPAPPGEEEAPIDPPTTLSDIGWVIKFILFNLLLLSGQVHAEIDSRKAHGLAGTDNDPRARPGHDHTGSGTNNGSDAGPSTSESATSAHVPPASFDGMSGAHHVPHTESHDRFPTEEENPASADLAEIDQRQDEYPALRDPRSTNHKKRKFQKLKVTAKKNDEALSAYRDLICNTPLQTAMEQLVTRRELARFLMQMHGLDPDQVFIYEYPINPQEYHKLAPREISAIDIFIDMQTHPQTYKPPPGYEVLRHIDLDQIFWDLMESVKTRTKENIFEKAKKALEEKHNFRLFMGRGTYSVRPISVYDQDWWSLVKNSLGGSPAATSVIAYIINFEEWKGEDRSFIIASNHPDVVLPISTDYAKQVEFVKENKKLFFSQELKLDEKEYGKDYIIAIDDATRKASYRDETVNAAAEEISNRLVNSIKEEAFGATGKEGVIDFFMGHIPFYSALKAYRRYEYTEAAVHGILDGLSFVGGPLSNAFKRLGLNKIAGVFQKVGKLNILSAPNDALEKNAWRVVKAVSRKVEKSAPRVGAVGREIINEIGKERVSAGGEWLFDRAAKEVGQVYNVKDYLIDRAKSDRETDSKYGGAAKCE
ncbi:hypothetical protein C0Z17_13640 [Trinickia caryophylli]|nr:hypothetical protein C0Z17_13640 [Trinickia caryophylli]